MTYEKLISYIKFESSGENPFGYLFVTIVGGA
jgi:hypothetical protein